MSYNENDFGGFSKNNQNSGTNNGQNINNGESGLKTDETNSSNIDLNNGSGSYGNNTTSDSLGGAKGDNSKKLSEMSSAEKKQALAGDAVDYSTGNYAGIADRHKEDIKDGTKKAAAAKAATGAAKTTAKAALINKGIGAVRGLFQMISGFIKAVGSKIAGAFVAAGNFLAGLLGMSVAAATAVVGGSAFMAVALTIAMIFNVVTVNMIQKTDDIDCVPEVYCGDALATSEQANRVVQLAEEYASHEPHYKYNVKTQYDTWTFTTANAGKDGAGIECGHFVQSMFHKANSTILTPSKKYGVVDSLHDAVKSYDVKTYSSKSEFDEDDCQPGDILFFAETGSSNLQHVAIYVGEGMICHASNNSMATSGTMQYADKNGYLGVIKTPVSYSASGNRWVKYVSRPYTQSGTVTLSGKGGEVVEAGKQQIGKTRYSHDNTTLERCDCVGFVRLIYKKVCDFNWVGEASSYSAEGAHSVGVWKLYNYFKEGSTYENLGKVGTDLLQPGDVMFFLRHDGTSHVGIYAGGGEILHCTSTPKNNKPGGVELRSLKSSGQLAGYAPYVGAFRIVGGGELSAVSAEDCLDNDSPSGFTTKTTKFTKANESQSAFIKRVGEEARKSWDTYHIFPSVIIAQAIIESAWGTSNFAVKRNNLFGIGAFDSNPDKAYTFTDEQAVFACPRNYWSGASPHYWNVIIQTNARDQAVAVGNSGWASSKYKDEHGGGPGSSLLELMDIYNLYKWDEGLKPWDPNTAKDRYGGSTSALDTAEADTNGALAKLNSDDGCGKTFKSGFMFGGPGLITEDGMTFLNFDRVKIKQIGNQLSGGTSWPAASTGCGSFTAGYGNLVAYGEVKSFGFCGGGTSNGSNGAKGGSSNKGSTSELVKAVFEHITNNKKPVGISVYNSNTGHNHYVLAIGFKEGTSSATASWNDLVILDPASTKQPRLMEGSGYLEYEGHGGCAWADPFRCNLF